MVDGWSLARVLTDLLRLYARRLGDAVTLPPAPPEMLSHFLRQEDAALADPETVSFWDRTLAEIPAAGLAESDVDLVRNEIRLDPEAVSDARRVAREEGVPLRSVMYAAHVQALADHPGIRMAPGLVVSGRPDVSGADEAAGLFLNMVPVPVTTGKPRQAAREAWERELDLLPHRRYPYAEMQRRLGRPPFDALFNYTHFHVYEELAELTRLEVLEWWYHDRTTFPMTVEVVVDRLPDAVTLLVTRDPDRVPDGFPAVFTAALRSMAADQTG